MTNTTKKPRGRPATGRSTRVIRLPKTLIEELETAAKPYGMLTAFLSAVVEGSIGQPLVMETVKATGPLERLNSPPHKRRHRSASGDGL